jgi:signal peptidase I
MYDRYQKVGRELSDASISEQTTLRLKITSQSMSPILVSGDYVLVKSTPSEEIHRGALLVTRRDSCYLTHRLIGVCPQGWITKGDRNNQADAAVGAQEIIGMVVACERSGKIYNMNTRSRRLFSRLHGWLGWQEINCRSQMGVWSVRLISSVLQIISK